MNFQFSTFLLQFSLCVQKFIIRNIIYLLEIIGCNVEEFEKCFVFILISNTKWKKFILFDIVVQRADIMFAIDSPMQSNLHHISSIKVGGKCSEILYIWCILTMKGWLDPFCGPFSKITAIVSLKKKPFSVIFQMINTRTKFFLPIE